MPGSYTFYRAIIKGSFSLHLGWSVNFLQTRIYGNYSIEIIKARQVKILEFKEYNRKIVSADKAREKET